MFLFDTALFLSAVDERNGYWDAEFPKNTIRKSA